MHLSLSSAAGERRLLRGAGLRWVGRAALLVLLGCGSGDGPVRPLGPGAPSGAFSPPARCLQPFEVGPCNALFEVFAYVGGACVPEIYGGCEGNDNRFASLEECLATCEGRPQPRVCPAGRAPREICLACGPAGGCATFGTFCAQPCAADDDCVSSGIWCHQGTCQAHGCD